MFNALHRPFHRVGKLLQLELSVFTYCIACVCFAGFGLAKTSWVHDGLGTNLPDEWCMSVPDQQEFGVNQFEFLRPQVRFLWAITVERIGRNCVAEIEPLIVSLKQPR